MLEEIYRQSYQNKSISEDMALTNFNPNLVPILDEDVIVSLLDVKQSVYYHDKNTELYVIGLKILTDLLEDEKDNEAHMIFDLLCLEEVLDNINAENMSDLKEYYEMVIEELSKNQDQNAQKTLKLKQIFQKKLPDYLK